MPPSQDRRRSYQGPPFLSHGFRPFFFLAGLWAAFAVPVWLWLYTAAPFPFLTLPGPIWHAHEMIFGYLAAVLTGFLLTAIPNWTGRLPIMGLPLLALVLLWLALGGLLLIYEPHFNLKSRRPHVAFMIASLLLVTVVLPRTAAAWTAGTRDLARSAMGSYRVISNASAADRYISMLVADKAWAARAGLDDTRALMRLPISGLAASHSVDSIIQQLILSKQRHSVVALSLPASRWMSLRPMQQRGLVAAAVEALRPDGTFVMRFTDVPPKWDGRKLARQRVEEGLGQAQAAFAIDEIDSGDAVMREWVLLASNRSAGQPARGRTADLAARE